MYLKINEEYADGELALLADLLSMLDKEIMKIQKAIASSNDPESDGLLDRCEYFIGIGLTGIQQYLADTLTFTGVKKKNALTLGPAYKEGLAFVAVLNAAANWWKHSAEWYAEPTLRKDALRTQQVIGEVAESEEYVMSNVLAGLLRTPNVTLSSLLPNLVLWRSAVEKESGKNA